MPLTLLPLSISSFTLFWLCVSDSVSSVRESKLKKWSIGLWLAWARATAAVVAVHWTSRTELFKLCCCCCCFNTTQAAQIGLNVSRLQQQHYRCTMCLFSVGRCKSSRCKALVNSYTARRKMGWEIWLTFLIGVTLFLLFICLFPTSTSLTFTCRTLQHSSLDWSQLIRRRCNICVK